jgi:hypothetical protein
MILLQHYHGKQIGITTDSPGSSYSNDEIPVAGDAFERFHRAAGMRSSSVHPFLKA